MDETTFEEHNRDCRRSGFEKWYRIFQNMSCNFDHQICFQFLRCNLYSNVRKTGCVVILWAYVLYHLPTAAKTEVPGVTGATAEGLTNSNCCQYLKLIIVIAVTF